MSDRIFALFVGAFLGWGLAMIFNALLFQGCSEALSECRSGSTCEQRALAAYAESLALGLYNADEMPR